MADEEKERAEKLAAARKRVEKLKKQKKKDQAEAKSKGDKANFGEGPPNANDSIKSNDTVVEDTATDAKITDDNETDPSGVSDIPPASNIANSVEVDETGGIEADGQALASGPSLFEQSRMRSESFKRGTSQPSVPPPGLKIPPTSPGGGDSITEIYKKQAARIEQLEKENKRLEKDVEDKQRSLNRAEQEVDDLREAQADIADLRLKAGRVENIEDEKEKLKAEIVSLQRQNAQLQSQVKENRRRTSSGVLPSFQPTEDLQAQISAKTNTIETLEIELSNLRYNVTTNQSENATLASRITTLESSLTGTEVELTLVQNELASLKTSSSTGDATINDSSSSTIPTAADETRMQLLTRDLAAAQAAATDATARAANLEKKIDALTTLHRESEARNHASVAARTKELERLRAEAAEMRSKVVATSSENARLRAGSVSSANAPLPIARGAEDAADDHMEPAQQELQTRVRELEAEVHELRAGVWRDRRIQLQGNGMENEDELVDADLDDPGVHSPRSVYDDVDLNVSTTSTPPAVQRTRSSPYDTFANVLSAFTGTGPRAGAGTAILGGGRRQSLRGQGLQLAGSLFGTEASGFLGGRNGDEPELTDDADDNDDDFAFDEDAFRKAQEEAAHKRLERVREVKRGLKEWEGWRVDLVDLRGGPAAGIFDV